ncbi:NAD(P)H-dependent flavin oxidoreductase [Deinococcus budaensis]|uniref:Propionate 3-nitronate monooxygenase n=1 Tax=Deinococcus budaensis TaxID=1665626 RepID=A0A7W8GDJ7_9DEIO|nr:nitronate monooxygenase [Deinococcus budaensis]MBB5233518.1 nitronate monooxygenase [Deinococcus budaensis]
MNGRMDRLELNRLGLRVRVVQAPMAGGVSTPALVAAVSQAGGLGSLGAAYLTPRQIAQAGAAVRARTDRPFAVNLFIPGPLPEVTAEEVAAAVADLAPLHAELGLMPPALPGQVQEDFEAQFRAVLELRPAVFSFAFGQLGAEKVAALRAAGILVMGTATSGLEASALARNGVDAVVVQGGAAGGHRGGWTHDGLEDTLHLTRVAVRAVNVPVIAAGGLMDAADVRAALGAGASLAQCGTAFLRAREAGTSAPYRAALAAARVGDTTLTRAFSGKAARGLANRVTASVGRPLPYPLQNALTRDLRAAASRAGRPEFLSLWAGEGAHRGREGTAAELLAGLWP